MILKSLVCRKVPLSFDDFKYSVESKKSNLNVYHFCQFKVISVKLLVLVSSLLGLIINTHNTLLCSLFCKYSVVLVFLLK